MNLRVSRQASVFLKLVQEDWAYSIVAKKDLTVDFNFFSKPHYIIFKLRKHLFEPQFIIQLNVTKRSFKIIVYQYFPTFLVQALSNQKYRELYEEFQDVGLMTGDVTINPSASALVMTTEVDNTFKQQIVYHLVFMLGNLSALLIAFSSSLINLFI